ncbi:MAG: hypothetical protein ACAI25_02880 [Planctomycetota bacterium]
MKIRSALLIAFFLSSGCISTEEPGPMRFPEEPIRRQRAAPELVPPAEHVTPTERWKAELARIAPQGWTVGDAVDQLEAPDGWSRIEGGRGIAFTITRKDKSFTVWFLPRDWKGKDDRTAPVRLFGCNADWQMFYTAAGHEGWAKPEEDVAKAFKVAFPARG